MRTIERRLKALEQGGEPRAPTPTPADIAATVLQSWRIVGMTPPNRAALTRRAKGGTASNAAIKQAAGQLPEDVLRALAALPV